MALFHKYAHTTFTYIILTLKNINLFLNLFSVLSHFSFATQLFFSENAAINILVEVKSIFLYVKRVKFFLMYRGGTLHFCRTDLKLNISYE
jgi:hypothetical protein